MTPPAHPAGVVVVIGRTLASARALRALRLDLAEAQLGSLMSDVSMRGMRVRAVYVQAGLDVLESAKLRRVLGVALLLQRSLRLSGEPEVFHVLPAGGVGAVVSTPADRYVDGVKQCLAISE